MKNRNWNNWSTKSWQFIALVALLVVATGFSAFNLSRMNNVAYDATQNYADEITAMISLNLQSNMENRQATMHGLADSIAQLNSDISTDDLSLLGRFLARKAEIHGLDALLLYDESGHCIIHSLRTALDLDADSWYLSEEFGAALRSESGLGVTRAEQPRDQKVFYIVPVSTGGTLVGVFAQASLQKTMRESAYQGATMSCIVDAEARPIVVPTNADPFMYLEQVDQKSSLDRIAQLLSEHTAGSIYFDGEDGEPYLLAVDPLSLNGWCLLTIVPANLVLKSSIPYVRSFALVLAAILAMFTLLVIWIFFSGRRNYRRLQALTNEDTVTGGLNGQAFEQRYRNFLQKHGITDHAIVMMNIHSFRQINDRLGFETGNEILRIIHGCISSALNEDRQEFVCRSESDHFYLCLDESDKDVIQARVDHILALIQDSLPANGINYPVDILCGCCIDSDPACDVQLVRERALIAEHHNSLETGRCLFWDGAVVTRLERNAQLEYMFDDALAAGQFEIYLQPKVALSGGIHGAEALIRWNHPEYGRISPGDFIPMLERSEKIHRLDLFGFEQVCRLYAARRDMGLSWYPVSVNLSRFNFYRADALDEFFEMAEHYDLPAGAVEFEVTESIFLDQSQINTLSLAINRMHAHGFACSIDDFGAGYSSLGILRQFDADTIKLDRSFFTDLSTQKAREIVRGVVALTKSLGIATVAEGVELASTVAFLQQLGVTAVQGYYYARPMPIPEFEKWLTLHESANQ